jgi:phytoene synthase
MQREERSSWLLAETRRCEPDRYLCALLAPPERRDALLALALLHHELARIPDIVSQPMAGMIRLQWWREALDELAAARPARRHPVVEALAPPLAAGLVEPEALHGLIDAREAALERLPAELGALESYAATTSGALQSVVYGALGGRDPVEARAAALIGTAYGLARLGDALAGEARADETMAALLDELRARVAERRSQGRNLARRPARPLIAAFLPASLVESGTSPSPWAPLPLALRWLLRRP